MDDQKTPSLLEDSLIQYRISKSNLCDAALSELHRQSQNQQNPSPLPQREALPPDLASTILYFQTNGISSTTSLPNT